MAQVAAKEKEKDLTTFPDLPSAFRALVRILEGRGVEYAVLGAYARAAWGTERATKDVDLTARVPEDRFADMVEALALAGFDRVRHPRVPATDSSVPDLLNFQFRTADRPDPVRIDVLVSKVEYQDLTLSRKIRGETSAVGCWLVSPEDLIIHKLIAHRGKDLLDIEDVVATCRVKGRALHWTYIKKWAKEWGVREYLKPFLPKRVRAKGGKGSRRRRTSRR